MRSEELGGKRKNLFRYLPNPTPPGASTKNSFFFNPRARTCPNIGKHNYFTRYMTAGSSYLFVPKYETLFTLCLTFL